MPAPRIAIFGLHLEANAFAPPTVEEDFRALCWAEGEEITKGAREVSKLPSELPGFYERMDETGDWEPVPLIMVAAPPGGPIEAPLFARIKDRMEEMLRAALPVDAIYVASHGASAVDGLEDSDGTLVALAREIVGPDIPIVVSHDLHCNISEKLTDAADALLAYRTNPHVDMRQIASESADVLRAMLGGQKVANAFIRLPLVPPSVTLLTARGPYARMIRRAEEVMQRDDIANVSITGGFAQSDLSKCGMTVNVTTWGDQALADQVCTDLAQELWDDRGSYVTNMMELEDAVSLALSSEKPVIFADVADNPGGGGRGNTTYVLRAFHEAKVPDCAFGVLVDPALAAEMHEKGVGTTFKAVFNREPGLYSDTFEAEAEILCLTDGNDIGRRGTLAGRKFDLGDAGLLRLTDSGLLVVVGSLRRQLLEPRMLEMHGIDIAKLHCVVVKSRGHFRAGFDEFFPPEQTFEVDVPGLVSANFSRLDFKHLPRPVVPLDPETVWTPGVK
ncbi:M81 family metallopeptidase [Pseudooceanicola nanhaiensis]|uniref:M81 family metallopeptidase n=1 Tax=Pseudooceanicola nanhaiensis TaxID=375761 RepID=UPI001CD5DCC2|nr:M81 family metallopeptidase [Pseudooceanicola nanhaiensis]MCA0921541.1 M81 family metallopeptidase [Pseudooceanicola nanhaiensis]